MDGAPDAAAPAGQQVARPGFVELAFGEPDPALFPYDDLKAAAQAALGGGDAALVYGSNEGPPELRRLLAERIAATEGRRPGDDELAITGGVSQALDQAVSLFTEPGDTVLVELPTYSLALGVLRDHPVRLEGVPFDGDGLDVEALGRRLADGQAPPPRLLYTIPTHHNPTGVSLAADRRRRLVELAAAHDLLIVEDDVYRELGYGEPSPASLWSLAAPGAVLRLGSFSKSLAPGLRVGWVTGATDHVARFTGSGLLESGGCVSQFAAEVVARYLAAGHYEGQVARLRAAYAARRDAFVAALRQSLPRGCDLVAPRGGFFVWVMLPEGLTASALLPAAEARRVSFVPEARCRVDGADGALRLCFTWYDEPTLAEGAARLGAAVADALAGRPA